MICDLIIEALLALIDDHNPVGDLRWVDHPFIDASIGVVRSKGMHGCKTYRFHAPSRGFWHTKFRMVFSLGKARENIPRWAVWRTGGTLELGR